MMVQRLSIAIATHPRNIDSAEFVASCLGLRGHRCAVIYSAGARASMEGYDLWVNLCCSLAPVLGPPEGVLTVSLWSSHETKPEGWQGFGSLLGLYQFCRDLVEIRRVNAEHDTVS